MDWPYLAQDRGQWLALVNTAMNMGISLTTEKLLAFQDGFYSMNLVSYKSIDILSTS
jgi:hypothetical protein